MDANPNSAMSIDWRASLVPAAAVIPASRAYADTVAVKKLVVDLTERRAVRAHPVGAACGLEPAGGWIFVSQTSGPNQQRGLVYGWDQPIQNPYRSGSSILQVVSGAPDRVSRRSTSAEASFSGSGLLDWCPTAVLLETWA